MCGSKCKCKYVSVNVKVDVIVSINVNINVNVNPVNININSLNPSRSFNLQGSCSQYILLLIALCKIKVNLQNPVYILPRTHVNFPFNFRNKETMTFCPEEK